MTKCRLWLAGLLALTAAGAAPAFAAPPSPPAPAAAADAKLEVQKMAFLALPDADRKAVQDALGWLDFYNGAIDGAFGKRTRDSIVAYQQSVSAVANGIVTPAELEALKTAAERARAAVGFALVDDRISGVRIGAPLKLLTKLKPSSGDTTLQSGDGGVFLVLQGRAGAGDDAGLAALYAQLTAEAGGRKITYKAIKVGEFFVVAGEDKSAKFYTRFARSPADWPDGPALRGFTFAYPSERSSDFDKLTLAVANSFDPFADTAASHGAAHMQVVSARSPLDVVRVATSAPVFAGPAIGLSPGARPTPTPPSGQSPTPAPTTPGELRVTALFVAPGQALDGSVGRRLRRPHGRWQVGQDPARRCAERADADRRRIRRRRKCAGACQRRDRPRRTKCLAGGRETGDRSEPRNSRADRRGQLRRRRRLGYERRWGAGFRSLRRARRRRRDDQGRAAARRRRRDRRTAQADQRRNRRRLSRDRSRNGGGARAGSVGWRDRDA